MSETLVRIPFKQVTLLGNLVIPKGARGLVLFAHGSGSSRLSPRNQYVAKELHQANIGTLLFDLLTAEEDEIYRTRFNIELLSERLRGATEWVKQQPETKQLAIGYFGASTGAAAALQVAAELGSSVKAVVSRGGRPDLAGEALSSVESPTLLIVGGDDVGVIELNQAAYEQIPAHKELSIVPGATHLFEEPGKLEEVASLAAAWFKRYLL